ncbi:MAG: sodium:alanine symporter family protein [Bdellovibrionaceae bacterium]|nr:sodium:alanine symporter family protein [Pseudobdellovibrionaceae bacterium]
MSDSEQAVGALDVFVTNLNATIEWLVGYVWSTPTILTLLGVGALYTIGLGFIQIRGAKHAIKILRGKYSTPEAEGQISHFEALTTALSSTVGLGNIAGVAVAISYGGPGATFWMLLAGMLGMATKYAEATLALKYRIIDETGVARGGPMYYITNGLGPKWKPMAIFFAVATAIGTFGGPNMFQSNQVASILNESFSINIHLTGIVLAVMTGAVILGGIQRIGKVTSKLVPFMVVIYLGGAFLVILLNLKEIPGVLMMVLDHAFNGTAAVGAFQGVVVKEVIIAGMRRAVFSNEAGMGTSAMAHSAAATKEPIREGTVALLEPFVDTMICFCSTAMVILISGVWKDGGNGVVLTAKAFDAAVPIPGFGQYLVPLVVLLFGYSTLLSWSYYGEVALNYLIGNKSIFYYRVLFCICIYIGAIWSLDPIIAFSDLLFGLMVIPNLIALLLLFKDVKKDTISYYDRLAAGEFEKVKS